MLGAGLLAQKAVEKGLKVAPYIKTSLSPGSGVVTYYLRESGVVPALDALGFTNVGYGCMTCIGNSGPLEEPISEAVKKGDLVCCGVLSGKTLFRTFFLHSEILSNAHLGILILFSVVALSSFSFINLCISKVSWHELCMKQQCASMLFYAKMKIQFPALISVHRIKQR